MQSKTKVEAVFTSTIAAYNLIRIPKRMAAAASTSGKAERRGGKASYTNRAADAKTLPKTTTTPIEAFFSNLLVPLHSDYDSFIGLETAAGLG